MNAFAAVEAELRQRKRREEREHERERDDDGDDDQAVLDRSQKYGRLIASLKFAERRLESGSTAACS